MRTGRGLSGAGRRFRWAGRVWRLGVYVKFGAVSGAVLEWFARSREVESEKRCMIG